MRKQIKEIKTVSRNLKNGHGKNNFGYFRQSDFFCRRETLLMQNALYEK